MFALHKFGAVLSGYFISPLPFAPGNRRAVRPCAQCAWELRDLWNLKKKIRAANRVFLMDPNSLVDALRGTIDPNLREAAEKQLSEVKLRPASDCVWACGAVRDRASLGHNIKMVPSRVPELSYRFLDAGHDAAVGAEGTVLRRIPRRHWWNCVDVMTALLCYDARVPRRETSASWEPAVALLLNRLTLTICSRPPWRRRITLLLWR